MEPTLRDSVFGKNLIKELPENFFETVLACEIKLKKGYNQHIFQELLNYYTKAIEYYESRDDPRYLQYSQSITLLLTQPEIAKHFKKEKEHPNYKLEVRKKFDNRDKEEDSNKVLTLLNQAQKEEDKVSNMNGIIEQEMDTQLSAFQKRKEAKKKKNPNGVMDDVSGNGGTKRKNIEKQKFKIVNKPNDIEDKKDNDKNVNKATDHIQLNLNTFLNEWSSILHNELMNNTYSKLDNEYQAKENALLTSARSYASQIQESELLLANEVNQTNKDQLRSMITQIEEQKRTEKRRIEEKYSTNTSNIQEYINKELLVNEGKKKIEMKFKQNLINDLSVLLLKD